MAALRGQATGVEGADATGVSTVAGDLIVVALREKDGNTMAVSDSINGAYTRAVAAPVTVAVGEIWYFRNAAGGSINLTVTGGSVRDYNVSVWSGMETGAGALDQTGSVTNLGTTNQTHDDTGITPSGQALVVTCFVGATTGAVTPHTGFTALTDNGSGSGGGSDERQYYAYKLAHTGAINPTHTTANSITTNACCAAFLESGGAPAGGNNYNRRLLLGVG